ncbi:outer membrane beta-barrel protein [Flavobacterium sp. PLA-1-15]|uniref:outer membrane beta-barrel protein n=1 Tax=Flavobacterium sp. PLA-1-15 TaxID=3380533 RepID=UPI003B7EA79E
MKKISLLICTGVLALTSVKSHAQEFYIRGGGGYSMENASTEFNNADPNGLTMIRQSTDITVNPDGSARVKSLNGTLGSGFKGNITVGYMFNKYIGAELGFNYFTGDEKTIGKLNSPLMRSEAKAYLEGLDVMPAIFLTPGFDKLNPYARFGFLIPVAGKLHIDSQAYAPDAGGEGVDVNVKARTEVESRFSVGFAGALGVAYPITPKLQIFGEVEIKSLSIKSKSAQIKEYETTAITPAGTSLVPGQQLADLPRNETHFEFEDSYTEGPEDPSKARKIPTQFVNASGLGFNIGVRYGFGK